MRALHFNLYVLKFEWKESYETYCYVSNFLKIGLGHDLDTYGTWKFMFNVTSKFLNVYKAPWALNNCVTLDESHFTFLRVSLLLFKMYLPPPSGED